MPVTLMPPRGHYLAHEVGRLAGVSGQQIGQWARHGYIRSSQSDGSPRVYSYQDVAEAMVVHALVEANLSYTAIRKTIEGLRQRYGDWPLSHVGEIKVPQDHPARTRQYRTIVVEGRNVPTGEVPLTEDGLVAIATDLRRGGWAARKLPWLAHIEVNPDRLSGRPAILGHRVPADHAGRLAQTSGGVRALRDDYDLTDREIEDAAQWWRAVDEYERAAA